MTTSTNKPKVKNPTPLPPEMTPQEENLEVKPQRKKRRGVITKAAMKSKLLPVPVKLPNHLWNNVGLKLKMAKHPIKKPSKKRHPKMYQLWRSHKQHSEKRYAETAIVKELVGKRVTNRIKVAVQDHWNRVEVLTIKFKEQVATDHKVKLTKEDWKLIHKEWPTLRSLDETDPTLTE